MAPPSVGVAMPRKMVPRTRKISASGGTSTKTTLRAMPDSLFQPSRWSASVMAKAKTTASVMAQITAFCSITGASSR